MYTTALLGVAAFALGIFSFLVSNGAPQQAVSMLIVLVGAVFMSASFIIAEFRRGPHQLPRKRQCQQCMEFCFETAKICPHCGHEFPAI